MGEKSQMAKKVFNKIINLTKSDLSITEKLADFKNYKINISVITHIFEGKG